MTERRIRRVLRRLNERPRSRDAVTAVAYLLAGLALLQFGGYALWSEIALVDEPAGFLVILVAMALLATLRSTRPFLVLLLGTTLAVCDLLLGGSLGAAILLADFVYCAFRYGNDRGVRLLLWGILALALATITALVVWFRGSGLAAGIALQGALTTLIGGVWGWNVRSERLSTRSAMALRHAAETERLRRRIAHDLHDHVANHIAVAGLHIEAARLRGAQSGELPSGVSQSLDKATAGTDQAHQRLRQLIAVLTTMSDLEENPLQTPDSLEELLPTGRALVRRGRELGDVLAEYDTSSAQILQRVVRELVMNAVKHGEGDITLAVTDEEVRVTNAPARATAMPGTGIGATGAALLLADIDARLSSQRSQDSERWEAVIALAPVREGGSTDG